MDAKLILEAARGTLDGMLSFPEVVGQLLAAGVEYYHVDYVGLPKRFYSAEGEMMATSINYEGLPPVASEFDAAALRGPCRTGHRGGWGVGLHRLSARQARHLLGPHGRPAHGMVSRCWAGHQTRQSSVSRCSRALCASRVRGEGVSPMEPLPRSNAQMVSLEAELVLNS